MIWQATVWGCSYKKSENIYSTWILCYNKSSIVRDFFPHFKKMIYIEVFFQQFKESWQKYILFHLLFRARLSYFMNLLTTISPKSTSRPEIIPMPIIKNTTKIFNLSLGFKKLFKKWNILRPKFSNSNLVSGFKSSSPHSQFSQNNFLHINPA